MKTIVLDEHTLGIVHKIGTYEHDGMEAFHLEILRTSIVKGSPHPSMGLIAFDPILDAGRFRPANEQDFLDFGVVFHPDYLDS